MKVSEAMTNFLEALAEFERVTSLSEAMTSGIKGREKAEIIGLLAQAGGRFFAGAFDQDFMDELVDDGYVEMVGSAAHLTSKGKEAFKRQTKSYAGLGEDNPWHKAGDGKFGGPGSGSWSLTCKRKRDCTNNAAQGGKTVKGENDKAKLDAAKKDPRRKEDQSGQIQQKDCGSNARTAGGNIRCSDGAEIEPLGKRTQFQKGQKKPAKKG